MIRHDRLKGHRENVYTTLTVCSYGKSIMIIIYNLLTGGSKMKSNIAKLAALLLAASICASLAGCGDSKTEDNSNKDQVDAALSELE